MARAFTLPVAPLHNHAIASYAPIAVASRGRLIVEAS